MVVLKEHGKTQKLNSRVWTTVTFIGLLCEAQYNVKQSLNARLYFAHLYKESLVLGVEQILFIARNQNFALHTMALHSYVTPCDGALYQPVMSRNSKWPVIIAQDKGGRCIIFLK